MVGRQVPEVALHDVQRDAGVEQGGGLGVAESVGAVEVDQGAGAVADVQPSGQLGQQAPQPPIRVGPVAVAVLFAARNRYFGVVRGRAVFGEVPPRPLLLLPDDRDDLGVARGWCWERRRSSFAGSGAWQRTRLASSCRIGLPSCGGGGSGNSGSRSSMQISLTRRPVQATSMGSASPARHRTRRRSTAAPSRSSAGHDLRHASSSMTSPSSRAACLPGSLTAPVETACCGPSRSQPGSASAAAARPLWSAMNR